MPSSSRLGVWGSWNTNIDFMEDAVPVKMREKDPGTIGVYEHSFVDTAKTTAWPCDTNKLASFIVGEGEDQTRFTVQKDIACCRSPVLNAAFKGKFSAGESQLYNLGHVDPEVFRYFWAWLHMQALPQPFTIDFSGNVQGHLQESCPTQHRPQLQQLIATYLKLWILGQELLIPALQDQVIAYLLSVSAEAAITCLIGEAAYVYENTEASSPLRRLLVNLAVVKSSPERYIKHMSSFPDDFVTDLIFELHKNMSPQQNMLELAKLTPMNLRARTQSSANSKPTLCATKSIPTV